MKLLLTTVFVLFTMTQSAFAWKCVGPEYVCGPAHPTTRTRSFDPVEDVYHASRDLIGGTVLASYYASGYRTASGERFRPSAMTAASRTLPFGTRVRVTNVRNGRSVIVRINDRGPAKWTGKAIDLSRGAFRRIASTRQGVARVRIAVLD